MKPGRKPSHHKPGRIAKNGAVRSVSGQTWLLAGVIAGCCVLAGYVGVSQFGARNGLSAANGQVSGAGADVNNPIDAERAFGYLQQLCELGPRPSGSNSMRRQQELLKSHFEKLGGQVSLQTFAVRHPLNRNRRVPMANLIVQWRPDAHERVVLCAHYDTRPFPDQDRLRPRGTFIGANDGASGVALLMELAHHLPGLECKYGVDFVLFDGEEFVFNERNEYFLGSKAFATGYRADPPDYRYRWGVLLDMVADKELRIPQEGNSISWADTRPLVASIWSTAARLGVNEFVAAEGPFVNDDHLALRNEAGIPTCDIIDFSFGPRHSYWHTEADVPENCSAESLAKVTWVVLEWLKTAP